MRTIETTAVVTPSHSMTIQVPADIPAGLHRVIVVVESPPPLQKTPFTDGWPKYDVTLTNPNDTFRREDIYGDDGR